MSFKCKFQSGVALFVGGAVLAFAAGCGGSGSLHVPNGSGSTPAITKLTANGSPVDLGTHQVIGYGFLNGETFTVEYDEAFHIGVHTSTGVTALPDQIQNSDTVLNNIIAIEGAWIAGLYTDAEGVTHSYAWNFQTGKLYTLDHANTESLSSDGRTLYYQSFDAETSALLGHYKLDLASGTTSGPLSSSLNNLTIARSGASGSLLLYSMPPALPARITASTRVKTVVRPSLKTRTRDGERVQYFLWNGSSAIELQPLAGDTDLTAFDIDATTDVVGQSVSASGVQHPVLWKGTGVATALSIPAGYDQGSAESISSEGLIGGILFKGDTLNGVVWSGSNYEAKTVNALTGATGARNWEDATFDHNSKMLHSGDYTANLVQFFTGS